MRRGLLWLLPAALLLGVGVLAASSGEAERLRHLTSAGLLAVAAVAAGLHHGRRNGPAAAGLLTLLLFGSVAFAQVFAAPLASLGALAAVVLACTLALAGEHPLGDGMPELYPGGGVAGGLLPRVAAGALIGAAGWVHPAYLLLLPFVATPRPPATAERRPGRRAILLLAAGACALVVAAGWVAGVVPASWPAPPQPDRALDPRLVSWNLAYLLGGRHVGLLAGYLPAVLLVACRRRGDGRSGLLLGVAAATLVVTLWEPHDFWGGPQAAGNRWFLPLYGALWFVPRRLPRLRWLVLFAALAGLLVWPLWLRPRRAAPGVFAPLARYLPYETTQRHLPAVADWGGTGVRLRSLAPALREQEGTPVLDPAAGPAELLVASEQPLEALYLELGPRSGSEIEVAGGEVGETLFRPAGGVRFEIRLGEPRARHPMWWGDGDHFLYLLRVRMPDGPDRPVPVAIRARPVEALPRSIDR